MEELMEILRELRPDVDFETETALIDDGILGSFDITALVNEIMDVFDVTISMADLEPENFNSAEAIYEYIQSLQDYFRKKGAPYRRAFLPLRQDCLKLATEHLLTSVVLCGILFKHQMTRDRAVR